MKTLLLAAFTMMLLSSCDAMISKFDDPEPPEQMLPAATQTGRNTIGFRVDGQLWLPKGGFNNPHLLNSYDHRTFRVETNRLGTAPGAEGRLSHFALTIPLPVRHVTTYDLAEKLGTVCRFSIHSPDDYYIVDRPGAGTLQITRLDSVQHIIAGTFECTLVSPTTGQTVRITEGRFDLPY